MNATVANDWRLFSKASAVSGNVTIHAIPAAIASPNLIGAAYIGASDAFRCDVRLPRN